MKTLSFLSAVSAVIVLCGCSSTKAVESASGKNLNLDGYLMYGGIETIDAASNAPTGKLIIGRVTYRSRKLGIPADQKVPLSGFYKSTQTKSLFGTEEKIVEYDFTAENEAEAKLILEKMDSVK